MCTSGRNDLMIAGPAEVLRELRAALAGSGTAIDFTGVLPPPAGLSGSARHRWRLQHWGIAQPPASSQLVDDTPDQGALAYEMFTPTGAPVALVAHLAVTYPSVEITLIYERDPFIGATQYQWSGGGRVLLVDFTVVKHCGETRVAEPCFASGTAKPASPDRNRSMIAGSTRLQTSRPLTARRVCVRPGRRISPAAIGRCVNTARRHSRARAQDR
jgi:hypothetical protein